MPAQPMISAQAIRKDSTRFMAVSLGVGDQRFHSHKHTPVSTAGAFAAEKVALPGIFTKRFLARCGAACLST